MIGLPAMGYVISDPIYGSSNNPVLVSDVKCEPSQIGKAILECPFKYRPKLANHRDYRVTCGPPSG
jgi:hypothetical protein